MRQTCTCGAEIVLSRDAFSNHSTAATNEQDAFAAWRRRHAACPEAWRESLAARRAPAPESGTEQA